MVATLIAALALLAAALYLIVRPFVWAPRVSASAEPITHESIAAEPTPAMAVSSVAVATADVDVDMVSTDVPAVTEVSTPTPAPSEDDVRARVEAVIAARKAQLSAPKCTECQAPVSDDDVFCRSCGTKLR